MATTPTTARRTAKQPTNPVSGWFKQWLQTKDEAVQLGERQATLRDRLLGQIDEQGFDDEKGNRWIELPQPVEFTDHKGKTFLYSLLKKQRSLTPANPTPDPEKAQALLEELDLWLSEKQQKLVRDLQIQCPYAVVSLDVDVDAVAGAYFKGIISEEQYEAILRPQRETFSFIPAEQ